MTNMSSQDLDVHQLSEQDLPCAPFPGKGGQSFRVFVDSATHEAIVTHGRENTSVEVCGVLVGRLQKDDDGPYVAINASIRGEAATNKLAEVTFTHETWARINQEMDRQYTDQAIVGWYHTHPDFGIFLSDRDRFIHEHFFKRPGQVAFVVDPVEQLEGFFIP